MISTMTGLPTSCSTMADIVRWRAAEQPDRTAYTFLADGESQAVSLTYGELDRSARAVAAHLQSLASPGERAVLALPGDLSYRTAFFGCLQAGLVAVPFQVPRPDKGSGPLVAAVMASQATVVLTTSVVAQAMAPLLTDAPVLRALHWVVLEEIPEGIGDAWREPVVTDDDISFVLLTSGSTGIPKGVVHTHVSLIQGLSAQARNAGFTADSRVVSWLPPQFVGSVTADVLLPMVVGCEAILMPSQAFVERPGRWLELISRRGGTHSGGPNFAYDLCAQGVPAQERAALDLRSWEVAFCGGEAVRPHTIDEFIRAFAPSGFRAQAFTAAYGLTEAVGVSCTPTDVPQVFRSFRKTALEKGRVEIASEPGDEKTLAGSGRIGPDMRCVIVDPSSCIEAETTEVGEVWVTGPGVAHGYWKNIEETERSFRGYLADTGEGPFFRTGDLGFLHDGEMFITGRIKELIIIPGRNISPHDIEMAAGSADPALPRSAAAAFSVDVDDDEVLVVVQEVASRIGELAGVADAIRRSVAERIEVQPYAVVLVAPGSIPRTASGKLQRSLCRRAFLENRLEELERSVPRFDGRPRTSTSRIAARTSVERDLMDIWKEILRVEDIGIHDNFFALGGDSLLSMQMISRCRRAGWQVDVQQLLRAPTIAGLAAVTHRSAPVTGGSELVSGPVPLTPRQLRWLERVHPEDLKVADVGRLFAKQPMDPAVMEQVVHALLRQHDALRMRIEKIDGQWRQENPTQEGQQAFSYSDVSTLSESEQRQAISNRAAEMRYGLDLGRGPLMGMSLMHRGKSGPDVVLAAFNHLVFDAFSMRIFMEDLERAYEQLAAGDGVDLGPKTTSFKAWAERLVEYARSGDALAEIDYWSDEARAAAAPLPIETPPDHFGGSHLVSLTEEETDILLHRVPAVWNVEINDVLLTALVQALAPWTGRRSILVDLVGHGRAPVFPGVDLSRTVGYLAAHFPMLLDLGRATGTVEELTTVREQLQQVPNGGIGYGVLRYLCSGEHAVQPLLRLPVPQVMFKYDGQFDQTFADSRLFDFGVSSGKSWINPDEVGGQELMINPQVFHGRMSVIVRSGVVVHQRSTVERLAEDYLAALRGIIATC